MQRSLKTCVLFLAVALAITGCPKKKPATATPDTLDTSTTPVQTTVDVPKPSDPQPIDETPDLFAGDILAAQRTAEEKGLLGDVYFDFNKDELKPEARERLSKNAEFLKAHPDFQLTLEGHCDERGTNEYNLALGERRAAAARDYVVSLGVAGSRLRTISYGEERPLCSDSNEGCWQLNRRAHFLITGRSNVG
jgi:peptidoglycan-associated lipoprotein